ncbi:hypothetical protein HMPREF9381_0127 [Streptococcus sanguinis SK72]|uniref:Uncharacterized protein n=1 Tax=Streptococcus sanguinis SK72 TaxID=888809 RepID=F0HYY7_STRSA|nr:hypothetical protein [Streptococcus sanguinis]EGD30590.1 hypothetical protein HMPREF9381_0127 [Streptococcus sanguinis SK72]
MQKSKNQARFYKSAKEFLLFIFLIVRFDYIIIAKRLQANEENLNIKERLRHCILAAIFVILMIESSARMQDDPK